MSKGDLQDCMESESCFRGVKITLIILHSLSIIFLIIGAILVTILLTAASAQVDKNTASTTYTGNRAS
ncbi:unnamed protein product, partial [Medioppia subpectinata]